MDFNLKNLINEDKGDNKNNPNDITIESNIENMEIYAPTHPFRLSLRIKNFEDDKQYKSFIKKCEQLIRNSIEYKL
jgi:hypothetical protein